MLPFRHEQLLRLLIAAGVAAAVGFQIPAAHADTLDTPLIELGATGVAKQRLVITAGTSGAPAGFTIYWMTLADFQAQGSVWSPETSAGLHEAVYWGEPMLHVFPQESPTFRLAPRASITIEIGSHIDEAGISVSGPEELLAGVWYVFAVHANATDGWSRSELAQTPPNPTLPQLDCVYTQGYWKNHPEAWPITSMDLGSRHYVQSELLDIFNEPVAGNGLISLAHQLIATKLNIAYGASPSLIETRVAEADGLIAALVVPPVGVGYLRPSVTSALTQVLDDWNNGLVGPPHCESSAIEPGTWGMTKLIFR